jgi:hypothetical protein
MILDHMDDTSEEFFFALQAGAFAVWVHVVCEVVDTEVLGFEEG